MNTGLKKQIKKHISNLNSADDVYNIFRLLNFPDEMIFDVSYKRDKEDFGFKKEDFERIDNIYSILSFGDHLPVFLIETTTLTPSFIRSVSIKFDSMYMRFLLIFSITNDYSNVLFVLPNREKVEPGKYKLKLTKLNVNKDEIKDKNEYYTVIDTLSNIYYDNEPRWRNVWKKWRDAFNVERVTESFFEDYKTVFFRLRDKIKEQNISQKDAHEFTLQFLNRIMFIYFVSKKGWLEYSKFMSWFWNYYKKLNKYGSNDFYEKWLNQLFFNAFNNQSHKIDGLPDEVKELLLGFPYLNGGLFSENKYDLKEVDIKDSLFQDIFEFFEKYNFTIKEDMPFESEVAVDPQMIGYVYESLANVADEIYDRNDMGIFYTPRVEVDFMCRRSLVEYFSKNLSLIPKEKFYHFVFDLPEDKWKTEEYFSKNGYWHKLESACDNLSVVDPACGSGAFLVGMLNVLDELYKIIYKHTERDMTDFERKYRIIQYSLYGVDVMPWAIHAAELRLWLQLIIETELKGEELRKSPLLPNLNLNLRIGDSLVQEVGGVSFNVRTNDLDFSLRKKLDELKHEKRQYFENSRTARFKDLGQFQKEEIRLFEEIIKNRIENIHDKIEFLQKDSKRKQSTLGIVKTKKTFDDKKRTKTKNEITEFQDEVKKLRKIKEILNDPEKKPFVWDIDFAEIFGDKNGFDIVIGNPPYVRQELISPPNEIKSSVTTEEKAKYKEKLIKSVLDKFSVVKKFDKRSDYYIYFYFHGLSLLNENGTFCFITSNSWLDVGYGKNLQEFLLKFVPIHAIYDNPKRSFEHADVNTIITLFGAPILKDIEESYMKLNEKDNLHILNNTAKFVMFKKPFESVSNATNLIEIEKIQCSKGNEIIELVKNVLTDPDFRAFPVFQEDLLEDGWKYPDNYDITKGRFKKGTYESNKWGSKYLRAPDIFYTILEKGKGNILEIGSLGEVRYPIKTGINKFFYINKNDPKLQEIEKEFLISVVKSSKEFHQIMPKKDDLNYYLFSCNYSKKALEETGKKGALDYIKWGEKQTTTARQKTKEGIPWPKVPSVKGRTFWYSIESIKPAHILCNRFFDVRFFYGTFDFDVIEDQTFYGLTLKKEYINSKYVVVALLNSTISVLFTELLGRVALGEGVLQFAKYEMAKNLVYLPIESIDKTKVEKIFLDLSHRDITTIFSEIGINPDKDIRNQEPKLQKDRAKLDNIIFNELGLTEAERKEVYWCVCELVKQRLDKAMSLKGD